MAVHLRDIFRWDGFLHDARPLPLPRHPARIPPEIKTAVPSLYAGVRVLCRETLGPSREQICELIRRRLPGWNEKIQRREELERVLSTRPWKKLKPHETAKKILSHVFGISDKYVRLLIYGQ